MSSFLDPFKEYNRYALDVKEGKITACEAIKLACERYISWFDRDDIYFDEADVDKKIRFVSKMKHTTGKFAGKSFVLLPWQQFAFAGIFGWKWKETGYRVTKKVFMFMSRKQGKTSVVAALSLACAICDGESGGEIDMVANNAKQAAICYEQTKNYAESLDPNGKIFKRFRHNINIPLNKTIIQIHSSDSMGLDGFNSSVAIIDEFHASKDWGLYNVLQSSMGMRTQPLMIIITTAGFLVGEAYPCYSMYVTCKQILKDIKTDDTMFSLLYELDSEDSWEDEDVWIKCAPCLDETVSRDYLREQVTSAKNNSSLEVGVRTKNFNQFMQSENIWLPHDLIQNVMQKVNLDDYLSEEAFGGCDMSVVCDLTCHSICIPPNPNRAVNPDKFIFKSWLYIPDEAIQKSMNKEYYKEWVRNKWAFKTSGNAVDYEYILKDQLEIAEKVYFIDYGYDYYNARDWSVKAADAGLPISKFSQSLMNFNGPTKFLEMLIRTNKCIIDANPAVEWCFSNVELMIDHNENCKPTKANGDRNAKIDCVISMAEALGCYLVSDRYAPSAWVLK